MLYKRETLYKRENELQHFSNVIQRRYKEVNYNVSNVTQKRNIYIEKG